MSIKFLDLDAANVKESPVPYTGKPLLLCYYDVLLFFKNIWAIPGILHPWNQWPCKDMDELYPSLPNLTCLALHGFLIALQLFLLVSLPFLVMVPVWMAILYLAGVMSIVFATSWVLNGNEDFYESTVSLGDEVKKFDEECWIFMNGISIGRHWLKKNLDRLALTFRRPVTGVHNRTYGIIFDLIQCIIERNFCYATGDVRNAYALIKDRLMAEKHKKVVLILHSQGGIEGGLIVDWLLSEVPRDILQKLEIFTFGSAANHFNNPHRSAANTKVVNDSATISHNDKVVRHIEHYANDGDFVARWGLLSFNRTRNRYMGRAFIRSGMGHLLNQHYLNAMFPLGQDGHVTENGHFMNCDVSFSSKGAADKAKDCALETYLNDGNGEMGAIVEDCNSPVEPVSMERAESVLRAKLQNKKPKARGFSRLWEYRNGGSPAKCD